MLIPSLTLIVVAQPRIFPVAKLLGKPADVAQKAFMAAVRGIPSGKKPPAFQSWDYSEPVETGALSFFASRPKNGRFSATDKRTSVIFNASGSLRDGQVNEVWLDAPEAWTWQRHLQLAGLSPSSVRAKKISQWIELIGIRGLPAGTRVFRFKGVGHGGSTMEFQMPEPETMLQNLAIRVNPAKAEMGSERIQRQSRTPQNNRLTLGGKVCESGLSTGSGSKVSVELGGHATEFRAWVGVDDETAGKGLVVFKVVGDDKVLWESGPAKGGEPARQAKVNVRGVKRLDLIVEDGGDGPEGDHADWGYAALDWKDKKIRPQQIQTKAK